MASPLLYDPQDPKVIADPYPHYARLRREAPVHFHPVLRKWFVTRHEDVHALLRDPRMSSDVFSNEFGKLPRLARWLFRDIESNFTSAMLFRDPPGHTRTRGLVSAVFSPKRVQGLEPKLRGMAEELLAPALKRGHIEFMSEFAFAFPAMVVADLLGVPLKDLPRLKRWSETAADFVVRAKPSLVSSLRTNKVMRELVGFFAELVRRLRDRPEDNLISDLIRATDEHGALNEQELISMCNLLLVAGHETTTNLLGNAMVALLRRPARLRELRDDPKLLPAAVDELLRFDTSVQMIARAAREDVPLRGQTIKKGDLALLVLASANRDEAAFEDADELTWTRKPLRSLTFGHGVHFCVGSGLARLEAKVALSLLLEREIGLSTSSAPISYRASMSHRSPRRLPLTIR